MDDRTLPLTLNIKTARKAGHQAAIHPFAVCIHTIPFKSALAKIAENVGQSAKNAAIQFINCNQDCIMGQIISLWPASSDKQPAMTKRGHFH